MFKLKPIKKTPPNNQAGFTIIESLMAIIVISILMVGIAPVLALSVANRVQARRVELGAIAAKSYLDGIRTGSIAPPPVNTKTLDQIPAPSVNSPTCDNSTENITRDPEVANDPKDIYYCNTTSTEYYLYCVDGTADGSCNNDNFKDMIVQVFGYQPADPLGGSTNADNGYELGVRVYRADAFDGRTLKTAQQGTKVASANTGGTGLTATNVAPLVEMTTEVVGEDTNLSDLCELTDRKDEFNCN